MDLFGGVLLLSGIVPLVRALRANRRTTLRQPLGWSVLAWVAWMGVAWGPVLRPGQDVRLGHYLALCLTGCAGVAVLGARRPGAGAWNFVVIGLLAVLLLPVLNGLGEPRPEAAHWLFLGVTLAVPLLNYLATRLAAGAVLLAAGCGLEMAGLMGTALPAAVRSAAIGLLAAALWAAWAGLRSRRSFGSAFDQLWLAYRDRFGFVWGQRMREQFNRSAHHAGWPVALHWDGLRATASGAAPDAAALLATLRAVLKRFRSEEETGNPPAE